MSANKMLGKRWLVMAAAVLLSFCLVLGAAAEAAPAAAEVMEWYVTQESVVLYVRYNGQEQSAQAQVGTENVGDLTITGAKGDIPVVTWLVVDNSRSITQADRAKMKQMLTDLVAGRAPRERFNLCTFNTQLNVLLRDSESYAELKGQIDAIEFKDQYAYLTDALAEILDGEKAREGLEYVRIVVISDGVDINPEGLTRDELNQRLRERNVPIYTLGCKWTGNEQALKEMYALSRQSSARSWELTDLENTLSVVQEMGGAELPVCAQVTIPEELRDGAERGVQITFGDGASAQTAVVMPFGSGTAATPKPEPSVEPVPESEAPTSEPVAEEEPWWQPLLGLLPYAPYALLGVCLVVVAGVGVFLLLHRKKEQERIKPVMEAPYPSEMTDVLGPEQRENGTVILVNNERRLMLSLTDRANPSRHFEAPLRGRVSVGRNLSNQIVLDYEKSVSGSHCEIYLEGSTFWIRDLNSRNGTYADGIRVADVAEISNGSIIKLGRLELVVEIR